MLPGNYKHKNCLQIESISFFPDCFTVYDLNNDGYISRDEMFHLLKNSLTSQPNEEDPDEGIKDLVEITLKKMVRYNLIFKSIITNLYCSALQYDVCFHIFFPQQDHDHDGKLSLMDFVTAVKEENLLLEAFGPCLPDLTAIYTFEERVFKQEEEQ